MQEVVDKLIKFFPQDTAKVTEYLEKTKALLERDERVSIEDCWTWTPLISAEDYWTWDLLNCVVSEKRFDILELMMANGLKVDDTNGAEKKTPLHFAASAGDARAVNYLVNALEASIIARDYKNRTPADTALEFGHREIARSLDPERGPVFDSNHALLSSPKNSPPPPVPASGCSKAVCKFCTNTV